MKAAFLAALLALTPGVAAALSCMPHSVEAAFQQAQADDASFVIVRGVLDFDARALPKVDWDKQRATPELTLIDAELRGMSLTPDGFSLPFDKPVTLAVACYGPWCASAQQGSEVLAFVQLGGAGGASDVVAGGASDVVAGGASDVVATNPCGGYLFATPTPKMIRRVKACFAGKACAVTR